MYLGMYLRMYLRMYVCRTSGLPSSADPMAESPSPDLIDEEGRIAADFVPFDPSESSPAPSVVFPAYDGSPPKEQDIDQFIAEQAESAVDKTDLVPYQSE